MIKPAIVIVDDFPQILHKLKSDLEQKYSDHFRIIEADSGQQALNQLKEMNFAQRASGALTRLRARKPLRFIHGDEGRVPFGGEGAGNRSGTNALDRASTMLYTDCMDEPCSKSNRNVFSAWNAQGVWCPKCRRKVGFRLLMSS